ncbi:cation:proton antiporter [Rhizobium sp. C1]|uniref:cation:proton antiporter n=1 Tax=Rhizobium sp. C1 TaxID=1349799 RepID=UPI001E3009D3|nr:sodium:proton antiporter [Rhizobium sp. C1]MCD2178127.1 sodium:proton antiporter [Rhizobium sp. C1]
MLFQTISALVVATAVFSWINRRFLGLPSNVALLIMGMAAAFILLGVELVLPHETVPQRLKTALGEIDFYTTVMNGMLAFLLFAGAATMEWDKLRARAPMVSLLATIGVVVSAFLVAAICWLAAQALSLPIGFAWCLAFGALIAPTDAVAAIAALKSVDLQEALETEISGEALFNDGVSIVLFTVALQFAMTGPQNPQPTEIAIALVQQTAGGLLLGLTTGYLAFHAIRTVNDYSDEVLFSLALVMGTYGLAETLNVSGPIAVVIAGIFIGNRGAPLVMSKETRSYFFGFWRLVDYMLNGILFTLLGLEVLILNLHWTVVLNGVLAIPVVLAVRYVAVRFSMLSVEKWLDFGPGAPVLLTWSAIRGAISAALALALPASEARPFILAGTYAVIVFSVIVQTLTLPRLMKRYAGRPGDADRS